MSANRKAKYRPRIAEAFPDTDDQERPPRVSVRPGNAWAALSGTVHVEPHDKVAALVRIGDGKAEPCELEWYRRRLAIWAVSTGASLDATLGIKRSGQHSAHRVAYLARRNTAIRFIARALPATSQTAKAAQLAGIIRGEVEAPSQHVRDLVQDLFEKYRDDLPASGRRTFEILTDPEET